MKEYLTDDLGAFLNVSKILDDWDVLVDDRSGGDITNIWRFINLAIWKKVYAL
jgi:hypothetical protein